MTRDNLLQQIKERLNEVYGSRLKGIVLYGSEVRNENAEDSDIDLMVLLNGPVSFGKELRSIIEALYPLQLEVIRPLHAIPVDINVYEAGEFALYRNAKKEGFFAGGLDNLLSGSEGQEG